MFCTVQCVSVKSIMLLCNQVQYIVFTPVQSVSVKVIAVGFFTAQFSVYPSSAVLFSVIL